MSASPSRRERPAKPALTREGIIDTAVRVMSAEGLQRVTMRRLAQELDTGPASLYVYVANTAELHAAILDRLLGQVQLSPRGKEDWRERLIALLGSYEAVLFAHPALAHSALVTRPNGPHYLTLVETLLALMHEGQVPEVQAAWGVDILLQTATASAAEHSARAENASADEEWEKLTRALAGASASQHPHLHAQAANLVSGTPGERHRWSVEMQLNGILATPCPE
ncbi:TetR/AcrR family transcriptional regulator [Streptomyces sp. NPDC053780]|uniref:TetR/AcrR family transcriptional regulator n=1 Tax=unclassified Streptomyces TaxID=2593676 RepID=UPI00343F2FA6